MGCGALLLAGIKKNDGVRPIAVGDFLRRLAAKCLVKLGAEAALKALDPHQVGVGIPGGGRHSSIPSASSWTERETPGTW